MRYTFKDKDKYAFVILKYTITYKTKFLKFSKFYIFWEVAMYGSV